MDKLREKVSSRGTTDCPFQRYCLKRIGVNTTFSTIHWHPEAEILYMRHGEVEVRAGKQTFSLLPGQIAFIHPGELHAITNRATESSYDAFVYSLELLTLPDSHFFQQQIVAPFQSGTLRFPTLLQQSDPGYKATANALDTICNTDKHSEQYKRIVFYSMLGIYLTMEDHLLPDSVESLRNSNDALKTCLQYMSANFSQHLTLRQIAHQAHLHPNYLCALFKDYTGHTVFQHLIRIRIEKAAELLRTRTTSVAEVAAACGFESTGFFTKKFKSIIGCAPKEYSLRHK